MAFSENFDSGSGELSTSGSWTKVGNDPAAMLLDFYDGGLGASADGGSGDCGYVHTGQGTAARVEARLRRLSSGSPNLCPKFTDVNNHGGLRIIGTGSIGARLLIEDGGVQDDTGIRFQAVVDTWYAVEQDGAGGWEIEEGGTGATPSWSSVGTHTDAAHDAETVQGFACLSNTSATFGSATPWWDDYSADALGGGGTTVTGSATLNGTGAVTASGIVSLVGAAALAGSGALAADAAVAHTGDATLDGQGTLTAQGFLLQRSDAALNGVGTLSVDANVTLGGIAALDGEGTLSAVPTLTLRTSAALDGVGTLTADGTIGGAITGQATLDGIGTLSVSAAVGHTGSAALDGQGTLAAVLSLTLRSDSTLDGTGAISVTPTLTLGGDAALDGEGTLTADPRLVLRTTATLDGVGGLNATPFFDDLRSRESGWNQFVLDSDGRNSFTVTSGTPNQFEVD